MGNHIRTPWAEKRLDKKEKAIREKVLVCGVCGREIRGKEAGWDVDGSLCERCFEERYER